MDDEQWMVAAFVCLWFQVAVEGVLDAVAIRVVLNARRWQGESDESYTARSEDLCYQVHVHCVYLKMTLGNTQEDYLIHSYPLERN